MRGVLECGGMKSFSQDILEHRKFRAIFRQCCSRNLCKIALRVEKLLELLWLWEAWPPRTGSKNVFRDEIGLSKTVCLNRKSKDEELRTCQDYRWVSVNDMQHSVEPEKVFHENSRQIPRKRSFLAEFSNFQVELLTSTNISPTEQ